MASKSLVLEVISQFCCFSKPTGRYNLTYSLDGSAISFPLRIYHLDAPASFSRLERKRWADLKLLMS